jgi:orotidine-5'-phosphate decarboxylase
MLTREKKRFIHSYSLTTEEWSMIMLIILLTQLTSPYKLISVTKMIRKYLTKSGLIPNKKRMKSNRFVVISPEQLSALKKKIEKISFLISYLMKCPLSWGSMDSLNPWKI